MQTRPVTKDDLAASVIAVPPLARNREGEFLLSENRRLIEHIEEGGVDTLLYGGNANFYHIALSEYESVLAGLIGAASPETLVVPSAGPAFGTMMDQAAVLREFDFPTVMVLPQKEISTAEGVEEGIRRFAQAIDRPVVLYIKRDGYIEVDNVVRLVDGGFVSWIKYAVVRDAPAEDFYLKELVSEVDPGMVVSGMGEQPAIVHLRDFKLGGFTSGCVCVRPDLSDAMLKACQSEEWESAENIREKFRGLEDLRNQINPIRVLHDAVELAGIAETGPALPLLTNLSAAEKEAVKSSAAELLEL